LFSVLGPRFLEAVKNVIVYRITAPNATRKDYRDEAHQEAESQHIFYFLLVFDFCGIQVDTIV
jgi:hypothetical protein